MNHIQTIEIHLPVDTTYLILRQIGDVVNWRVVLADAEIHKLIWKHDGVTQVHATMEPFEFGTRVILLIDRYGAFDPFRQPSPILATMLDYFQKRADDCFAAFAEIVRVLTEAGLAKWVSREEVEQIIQKHQVELEDELRPQMTALYQQYMLWLSADGQLCEEDRKTLSHLENILRLNIQ